MTQSDPDEVIGPIAATISSSAASLLTAAQAPLFVPFESSATSLTVFAPDADAASLISSTASLMASWMPLTGSASPPERGITTPMETCPGPASPLPPPHAERQKPKSAATARENTADKFFSFQRSPRTKDAFPEVPKVRTILWLDRFPLSIPPAVLTASRPEAFTGPGL